jgi:hypothetical protein
MVFFILGTINDLVKEVSSIFCFRFGPGYLLC